MTAAPLLDVVVVTATGLDDHLHDCLDALARHAPAAGPARVWVVDNASSRPAAAGEVAALCPTARLLRLDRAASFAAANNAALHRTTAPNVLLLNPDTEVHPGALDVALDTLRADPGRGVVGVRLIRRDGSFDHAAKRSFPTVAGALGHFTGAARRLPALAQYTAPELDEHGAGEVDAVNGAFMLIRREALADVGPLDEGYRFYGEDLDWCYRAARAGWAVYYQGAAVVVHVKGGSTVTARRHRGLCLTYAFHHAMGRFYRKTRGGRHPVLDLAVYSGILLKFVVAATRSTAARRSLV